MSMRFARLLAAVGCCLMLLGCGLFDNTKLEAQQAQIEKNELELAALRAQTDALRQQAASERQTLKACNQAFQAFTAGRTSTDSDAAIAYYQDGLALCPDDEVARNELGELYLGLGDRPKAQAEFEAALRLNPKFSRARKNLDSIIHP